MPINENVIPLITRLETEIGDKYRELARQELERRLQQEAEALGLFSPLDPNSSDQAPSEKSDDTHPAG